MTICAALLLWGGAAPFGTGSAHAGSCCGGGAGGGLLAPRYSLAVFDASFDAERYDGFWDQEGRHKPDPPGSDLMQYRLSIGYARRLAPKWQASAVVPYVWNDNHYAGISSSSNGLGDATLSLWYEAREDTSAWKVRTASDLLPSVTIGTSLLVPTGVSPYDNVGSSFDVTGRGFYRVDANMIVEKTLQPWGLNVSMGYGTHLERSVNREYGRYVEPYKKRPGDRLSASVALSYNYYLGTKGDTLTGTVSAAHLQEARGTIEGHADSASGFRKDSLGATLAYSSTDSDWSWRASWSHAPSSDSWGENFPSTDVYTVGVRYVYR